MSTNTQDTQQADSMKMIRDIYEDKVATINGNDYEFTKCTHNDRRKVFAFFSSIQRQVQQGDFSFLDRPDFHAVEKTMCDRITFDGVPISKRPTHWEEYPGDYLQFISVAMGVISYPFMQGVAGG